MKQSIIIMLATLFLYGCNDMKEERRGCEGVNCTAIYKSISLLLNYPDGQPVLLDSAKVFWVSENRYLEQSPLNESINMRGYYPVVDDGMRRELQNKQEIMHFTGYLNGVIICERDVLVGADCCHVTYLGYEPLNQVIDDVSNEERERRFCEFINIKRIRDIIPSFNAFVGTINENLPYENKLQMIVEWFISHDCITNARIDCIRCERSYYGDPKSKIAFSFIENQETINIIMLVLDDDPYFGGFISEYLY
jgi:hypothetical protein